MTPRDCAACTARNQDHAEFLLKVDSLSPREREVLRAICKGMTPADCAKQLGISAKTYSTYRMRLLEKLDLKTNAHVVLCCERAGVIE